NWDEPRGPLAVRLLGRLDAVGRPYELILVDDGSIVASAARLCEAAHRVPALRVVRLRGNFGQTAALAAGFDQARGELVISMDGDGQNDPADIPRLLDKLREG